MSIDVSLDNQQPQQHTTLVSAKAGALTGVNHSSTASRPSGTQQPCDREATALGLIINGQLRMKHGPQRAGEEQFGTALEVLIELYAQEITGFCVELLQGYG